MNPENPLLHAKHVFRAAILLGLGLVALVLGRSIFIPETWGAHGPYRASNLAEQRAKEPVHGGDESCRPCHEEAWTEKTDGSHASVSCEVCHEPVTTHARDGIKVADMPTNPEADLCLLCHRMLDARPPGFPQVNPREHVERQGEEWSDEVCIWCHQPHEPL